MRTMTRSIKFLDVFVLLLVLSTFCVSVSWGAGSCERTVTADVVALDQVVFYNRYGAVNPQSTIYALREDVVDKTSLLPCSQGGTCSPGNVMLRPDKRPRPITLRMNVGDCLTVSFQNLLAPFPPPNPLAPPNPQAPPIPNPPVIPNADVPLTRNVGMHANGMQLVTNITDDGSNVGANPSGLVAPGGSQVYTWYAERENVNFLNSMGAVIGGEGNGGQTPNGLFGAVNVQPRGAEWYRSQVTNADMQLATTGTTPGGQPIINYQALYPTGHKFAGKPILAMLDAGNRIRHTDLNAIITGPGAAGFPAGTYRKVASEPNRDQPFREFTVIFHDETVMVQAFDEVYRDNAFKFTLNGVKDGFAINYGSGGIGTEILANRNGVGPTWDCPECKAEEFFLTSWALGDPAMVVDIPAAPGNAAQNPRVPGPKATKAFYPDDPSNVHHSYINDHVKFRNLHAGPKEHHIYHLHSHQWVFSPDDDGSNYLDAQHIGPGSGFTYEITFGGSGNRNKTPGDAIFHCHFYPHFAQGMWEMWRNHDVFEAGTVLGADGRPAPGSRAYPDGEIAAGTPIVALVPLPTIAMAPMPGLMHVKKVCLNPAQPSFCSSQAVFDEPTKNPGFPFIIAGVAGHRPPSPALDMDPAKGGFDGGLPRHVILGTGVPADPTAALSTVTPLSLDKVLLKVPVKFVPEFGDPIELVAQAYHAHRTAAGRPGFDSFTPSGTPALYELNGLPAIAGAPFADPCRTDVTAQPTGIPKTYKGVMFQFDMMLNKVGWHFPQSRIETFWQDALPTIDGIRPPEPFTMRANTFDCIDFQHVNLIPNVYEQDDFQVKMPTDIVGQHIHLVKFDVTASDGSANGWNYEDGTMSPDEIRERIAAINAFNPNGTGNPPDTVGRAADTPLVAQPHPFFGSSFNGRNILGARTTIQRWYSDPLEDNNGVIRPLGNVFTHDHFGPSQHQQAGLYATLLIEPPASTWRNPETGEIFGTRADGGPTSWRADILTPNPADSYREFFFEFQDFHLAYQKGACESFNGGGLPCNNPAGAINAPGRDEVGLPLIFAKPAVCPNGTLPPCPTAISANDDGTFSVNYRNEPVALRVLDNTNPLSPKQAAGLQGDLSWALSSLIPRKIAALNTQPNRYVPGRGAGQPLVKDMGANDPFTPLMRVYDKDRVKVRIQVGATEESHTASIHGVKWLQEPFSPNTGYRNSQALGISEQFILDTPVIADRTQIGPNADYLYSMSNSSNGYWNGTWGLMRSYGFQRNDLLPLPNNPIGTAGHFIGNLTEFRNADNRGICPLNAPLRSYDITAVSVSKALPPDPLLGIATLVYNPRTVTVAGAIVNPDQGAPFVAPSITGPLHDPTAIMYVKTADLDFSGKLNAAAPREPLVLRANAGDCIEVTLRNRLPVIAPDLPGFNSMPFIVEKFNANQVKPSSFVGLHPQLVEYDITQSDGANIGKNILPQTVEPFSFALRKYRWYAGDIRYDAATQKLVATPAEFGATNLISSDPIKHSNKGAVGALIIEPKGSTWTEDAGTRAEATVTTPVGSFREFVAIFQTDVNLRDKTGLAIPNLWRIEDSEDSGQSGINYRTEPIWFRLGINPFLNLSQTGAFDYTNAFSNAATGSDPVTPIFNARRNQDVRFRFLQPAGQHRNGVIALHGHVWEREPYINKSLAIGHNPLTEWRGAQEGFGPTSHYDIIPKHGAGGLFGVAGDYLYRNQASFGTAVGQWGLFRVTP